MRIIIVCGNPDCNKEFYAETGDAEWECPHCGRKIENRYYPFLSAKLMQAKIDADKTDWKEMYDKLLDAAREEVIKRDRRIKKLEEELEELRGKRDGS